MPKQYAEASNYESKLEKVMNRLSIDKYNYNWDRFSCWVEFTYKGAAYRFTHSVENAQAHGVNIKYGSDIFAQVVLSLEDLARMVERGIYDLSTWVAGMKMLPAPKAIPQCFTILQFTDIPASKEAVEKRFKQLSKTAHPDAGGSNEQFIMLQEAKDEAIKYIVEEVESHKN